ncbi:MAG: cell division protein FtsL [Gammaproteobacteria bacterium]|nr:cell division protein FtsL [Gammaproteobacteria bacterium]
MKPMKNKDPKTTLAILHTFNRRTGLLMLLGFLALMCAISVVYVKDFYRQRFIELNTIKSQNDALETVWSQLLLEETTWASHERIATLANAKLNMHTPELGEIKMLSEAQVKLQSQNNSHPS